MEMNNERFSEVSESIVNVFKNEGVDIKDSLVIIVGMLASIQKTLDIPKDYFWFEVLSLGNKFSDDLDGANNEH